MLSETHSFRIWTLLNYGFIWKKSSMMLALRLSRCIVSSSPAFTCACFLPRALETDPTASHMWGKRYTPWWPAPHFPSWRGRHTAVQQCLVTIRSFIPSLPAQLTCSSPWSMIPPVNFQQMFSVMWRNHRSNCLFPYKSFNQYIW